LHLGLLGLGLAWAVPSPAACDGCTSFLPGTPWGAATDSALTELSGIAASRRNPDVLWVHNDGPKDRVYALDTNGVLLATWKLSKSVDDLEDIASGPGPAPGVSYLYVGDIGGSVGNQTVRNEIRILRVPEPAVSTAWATNPVVADFDAVEKFTLRYPDGSFDAESLLLDPVTGDVLVVIKQPVYSRVYRASLPATAPSTTIPLTHLCNVAFVNASSGDISADGKQIVLRNETQATLWQRCDHEPIATTLARAGYSIPIVGPPAEPNGEAFGFLPDGSGYVTTGEGANPAVFFSAATCPVAPRFAVAPVDQAAFVGGSATFTARAYGHPAPTWQWRFGGQNLAGEISATLTLANLTAAQAGSYQVVVANASGSATNQATLTVRAKPDLRITEVLPSPTAGTGRADWWEVTSFEQQPVSLAGWRLNDTNGGLADSFVFPADLSIAPGESIVFVEGLTPAQFHTWWGTANLPPNLQIITYSGVGLGLRATGDGIRLWTDKATDVTDTVARVDFGVADSGVSFGYDFATGLFGTKSVDGTGGAFRCVTSTDVGSPGVIRAPSGPPAAGGINDLFANRIALTGSSNRVTAVNTNATKQAGEPSHGGNPGGRSLWWSWTASASGLATVKTEGSSFDTLLAVYTGAALDSLNLVVGNDDSVSDQTSLVIFSAVAGTVYQIAVDGYAGDTGTIHLIVAQGGNCSYTLLPAASQHPGTAVAGSFSVIASSGCSWAAVPGQGWLHTTSSGAASGTVAYTVDANLGKFLRVGSITVGGQAFKITQFGTGPARPRLDLNSDGTDDLVFQNGTGSLTTWLMNGQGQALSGKTIYNGNLGDWKLVALADVNSDGTTDLILQNTPGQIVAWLMNGQGQPTTGITIYGGNLGDWRVVAAADLNTDGKADLVFQNAAGQVVGWFMDGQGHATTGITIYGSSIYGWKVATMGDVNGDGIADLIWQTPLGSVVAWLMDGQGHSTIGVTLYGGTLAGWRIAGMKDMDGDGIGDLVWQSTSGSVLAWLMDGNSHPVVALSIYSGSLYDWLVH
jgi:hypothetical protein